MTAFFKEIEPFRGNGNENEKGQTLEEFLEEYDPYKYKNPCVTTDAVIFSCKRKVVDGEWKVLMVKRRNHPSIGWWALTGAYLSVVDEGQVKVQAGDDAADARWMQLHCQTESVKEDGDWKRTIYRLALENKEAELTISAIVEKKERSGLVRETYYKVKESDRIACDHAALIVQAWKLVESRLI